MPRKRQMTLAVKLRLQEGLAPLPVFKTGAFNRSATAPKVSAKRPGAHDRGTAQRRVIRLDRAQPGSPTSSGYPALAPYAARRCRAHPRGTRAPGPSGWGRCAPSNAITACRAKSWSPSGDMKPPMARSRAGSTCRRRLPRSWEGRRRELFASEWVSLMKVADKALFAANCRAAGRGLRQAAVPSFGLRRLAADGNGDGRADIMNNSADALASIANYFRDAGREGQPWGVGAYVPSGFDVAAYRTPIAAPVVRASMNGTASTSRCRNGAQRASSPSAHFADDVLVTLFQPDGPGTLGLAVNLELSGDPRIQLFELLRHECGALLADEIAEFTKGKLRSANAGRLRRRLKVHFERAPAGRKHRAPKAATALPPIIPSWSAIHSPSTA